MSRPDRTIILDARALARALQRMAVEVLELAHGTDDLVLIGIQRRGVELAERIARLIEQDEGVVVPRGALDITLYRDDLETVGPKPVIGETRIPGDLTGKHVVIVDDVLYTGRTVRAALDELADFGRPKRISLCVLVDRGGRELPIHPDIVGKQVKVNSGERVDVLVEELDGRRGGPGASGSAGVTAPPLGKDLVGLEDLSADQIRLILDTAEPFKEVSERPIKKVPALRGKTIVNLFFEASTRTRISFEFAEKRLSADTVNVAASGSSVQKGETLVDTARNLEAMRIDMVVIRHPSSGAAEFLGNRIRSNVINAGDGKHEHPTQGLLDLLTIRDKHGRIEGIKVCLVGDVLHSRVARSNIWGLLKLGAEVGVCGPDTLLPRGIEELGVCRFRRIEEAIEWADVLNVLRLQLERMEMGFIPSVREYYRVFGVTAERLEKAGRPMTIMHPGPMNRGVEIDSRVADGPHSVILDQVTNGVAVRMAVLYLLAGGRPELADAAKRSGGPE